MRREYPQIHIEVVANNAQDDLLERRADIAVRMVQPLQDSLVARRLGQVGLGAWVSQEHLNAKGIERITPEALSALDWIGEDRNNHILAGMQRMGKAFARERFVVRSDSDAVRWQALVQGMGAGFALDAQVAGQHGLLGVLPRAWVPALPVWLSAAQELRSNARIRVVFDHLAQTLPVLFSKEPVAADPEFPDGLGPARREGSGD